MVLEASRLSEPLLANFAFIRLFPGMGPRMTIECTHLAERLCADVALKVLHSVYPLQRVR